MAFTPDFRAYPGAPSAASAATVDAGLRAYMLRVYNWMASGLLLTGIVAYGIAETSLLDAFYRPVVSQFGQVHRAPTALAMIAMFAPLAFVMVLSFGVNRLSRTTVQALFWAFCVAMGASLTSIFIAYAHASIFSVFLVTAGMFAAMSIYGYTTKSDLSRMGSFLFMGLIGIVIAGLVNMFIANSALQFVISIAGVLVFTGLTAFDTQRIKADYLQFSYSSGSDIAARRSVYDALSLYLKFINLFMFLLQLMGNRSSNN